MNKAQQLVFCKKCRSQRLIKYKSSMERDFYRCMDCGALSSRNLGVGNE